MSNPRDNQRTDSEEGNSDPSILEVIQKHYATLRPAQPAPAPSASALSGSAHPIPQYNKKKSTTTEGSKHAPPESVGVCIHPDESLPGAYHQAPSSLELDVEIDSGSHPAGTDGQAECDRTVISSWNSADVADLVAAQRVEQQNLPQAQPFSAPTGTRSSKKYNGRCLGLLGILGVVLVIIGVVAGVLKNQKTSTTASLRIPTPAPTNKTVPLKTELLALLPDFTLPKIEDPETPQSRALDWMIQDPNLPNYCQDEPWRIQQRFSLATFYYSTNGENSWSYRDLWLSYEDHECTWFGRSLFSYPTPFDVFPTYNASLVPCNEEGVYQHLWLYNNGLSGSLPEEMYLLTQLRSVSLFDNQITGALSSRLGQLTQLEGWSVTNNPLGGSLPSEMGLLSSTLYFWASHNAQLTGTLPSEMGRLSKIETLVMDWNFLTGTIPTEISGWTNLVVWYGNMNQLSGTLPSELGQLESLVDIHLDVNRLTGSLPTELGLLDALKDIGVVANSLSGPLPTELGVLMTSLEVLELQANRFSGTVPSEYGNLPSLTHLLLQDNRLTGTVPAELRHLQEMTDTVSSSLKAINVTGNPSFEQEVVCWTHPTWYQSPECPKHYPTALSCWLCQCSC